MTFTPPALLPRLCHRTTAQGGCTSPRLCGKVGQCLQGTSDYDGSLRPHPVLSSCKALYGLGCNRPHACSEVGRCLMADPVEHAGWDGASAHPFMYGVFPLPPWARVVLVAVALGVVVLAAVLGAPQ